MKDKKKPIRKKKEPGKVRLRIRRFHQGINAAFERRPITGIILIALMTNLVIEILARHSFVKAGLFMITKPHLFGFNALIIAITLTLSMFFRKRVFVTTLITTVWLLLGLADAIILCFRTTPFSFSDVMVLKSVKSIITLYLKVWQIVAVVAGIVLLVGLMVIVYRKSPKWKRRPIRGGLSLAVGGGVLAYLVFLFLSNGVLLKNVYNIADAYRTQGFVTMFSESIFVRGVGKPDTYSARGIRDIARMLGIQEETPSRRKSKLESEPEPVSVEASQETPNVIYLQLESFFDPKHLKDLTYNMDPVPYYTELKERYSSGFLRVPSFGAGTANTEFEILTGMNLDYFGPGEYPFSSILRESTCESMAYNLREKGYVSHMIHNNKGSFYGRNVVYPNLGFDTFTSIEYMRDVKLNPLGWAKDAILTEQILNCLDSTDCQDLVYTISVQGHGKYPEEELEGYKIVQIEECGLPFWTETEITAFEYYLNQIRQMDDFLRDLTEALEERDEPTLLILYGDHLPDFPFEATNMDNDSLYETEYVIWSNMKMDREVKDLESYQLAASVMGRIGADNGVLTKLHQQRDQEKNTETYQEDLKTLEYDMLYGNRMIYSGKNPYPPAETQFGTQEVVLTEARYNPETRALMVKGENFTEWSAVSINGKQAAHTEYISPHTLLVEEVDIQEEDAIMVMQVTGDREVLSTTDEYYMLDMDGSGE